MQAIQAESGAILVSELKLADTFITRLKGLMFRATLPNGSGLLISPCKQVHTHFMRFSIDVIFLSKDYRVLHVEHHMKPWKFSRFYKEAQYVLELPAGRAESLQAGDTLKMGV